MQHTEQDDAQCGVKDVCTSDSRLAHKKKWSNVSSAKAVQLMKEQQARGPKVSDLLYQHQIKREHNEWAIVAQSSPFASHVYTTWQLLHRTLPSIVTSPCW